MINKQSKYLFYTFCWYILLMILCTILQAVAVLCGVNMSNPHILRGLQTFQSVVAFCGAPMIAYALHYKTTFWGYAKMDKGLSGKSVIFIVLLLIFSLPFVSLLAQINEEMTLPEAFSSVEMILRQMEQQAQDMVKLMMADSSWGSYLLNILIFGVVAAVTEEFFFRGWLLNAFRGAGLNYHVAIWLTAIIFSALHMQFFGFIPRIVLGAILGYIYCYSGSLWGSVLFHFLNNAFAVTATFIASNGGFDVESINAYDYGFIFGAFGIVAVALMIMFRRESKELL